MRTTQICSRFLFKISCKHIKILIWFCQVIMYLDITITYEVNICPCYFFFFLVCINLTLPCNELKQTFFIFTFPNSIHLCIFYSYVECFCCFPRLILSSHYFSWNCFFFHTELLFLSLLFIVLVHDLFLLLVNFVVQFVVIEFQWASSINQLMWVIFHSTSRI